MPIIFEKDKFIKNCIVLCRREGLTQKQFNSRIGYRDALTKWSVKKNPTMPSIDVINRIATEFDVDICWLIAGEGNVPNEKTEGIDTTGESNTMEYQKRLIEYLLAELKSIRSDRDFYRGLLNQRAPAGSESKEHHSQNSS